MIHYVYITYDTNNNNKVMAVSTYYQDIDQPGLPLEMGIEQAIIHDTDILQNGVSLNNYPLFLRNFDSFVYDTGSQKVILTGAINARYIAPIARDTSVPMALGRASTIGDFGAL